MIRSKLRIWLRYGVIHNLQGDVIGLFDNTGTEAEKNMIPSENY